MGGDKNSVVVFVKEENAMCAQKFWSKDRFPVVYEHDHAKAVIVDLGSFEKIEMILDNVMNRDLEEEDKMLVASGLLQELLNEAQATSAGHDWRAELDELWEDEFTRNPAAFKRTARMTQKKGICDNYKDFP